MPRVWHEAGPGSNIEDTLARLQCSEIEKALGHARMQFAAPVSGTRIEKLGHARLIGRGHPGIRHRRTPAHAWSIGCMCAQGAAEPSQQVDV
ncbi:hypothetical protein BJI67_06010 [Acidihalobacter aeolianus]|uniref:Uncharacterized protein n=1 Tax=Acidihalobacter aeolianus TaxID=2792603 RepID=A0A1D8K6S9_9GAMM|nr:hypothetical protein BJI67_06010 [Acidihalobacter aeolianus]